MIDTDPYLYVHNCAIRLFIEWKKHPQLIVAVDFDETLFDFHEKGYTHEKVIALLKRCQECGFYIVLFTASAPERHKFMNDYMLGRGIVLDSINENPIPLPYGNHGKIFYNILLDDRAGLGQAVETLTEVLKMIDNFTT
jgi:predicted mannosyl-3-phosphoglycerate phosphatase (HAD superfamily)